MDEILKVKEVCHILHISRSTLYKLIKTDQIKSFYINSNTTLRKHPRIYMSSVREYAQTHNISMRENSIMT